VLAGLVLGRARGWVAGTIAVGGFSAWWPSREASARPWTGQASIFKQLRDAGMYRYQQAAAGRDSAYAEIIRDAGVRDLMMISVHDLQYPLMRRLSRDASGVRFHGAPARGGEPDAILMLGLFQPMALYHSFNDGRRYRLVGASAGDGLYLPEDLVRNRGWGERLPSFAGWSSHEGFPLRYHAKNSGIDLAMTREMTGGRAIMRFSSRANVTHLRATVVKTSVLAEELAWWINGQEIGRIALAEGELAREIETSLPSRIGENTLELRRSGGDRPLRFDRLILNDIPTHRAP